MSLAMITLPINGGRIYIISMMDGVAVTNALAAFLLLNLNAKYAVQLLFYVMLAFGFIGGVGMILQLFTGA